jgi:hypothetical protein
VFVKLTKKAMRRRTTIAEPIKPYQNHNKGDTLINDGTFDGTFLKKILRT